MAASSAVCESKDDETVMEGGQKWLVRRVAVGDGRSVAVLVRDLTDDDSGLDPNFFDAEYSIEAATGNQLWEGARELARELARGPLGARVAAGAPIIELGAGTGLAGLSAAVLGAHVLLTDVRAIARGVLGRNIALNERDSSAGTEARPSCWSAHAVPIGAGSAMALPLDWHLPAREQLGELSLPPGLLILAADCVWHVDLLPPFVRTTCDLLRGSTGSTAYVASWERARPGSTVFLPTRMVRERFEAAGCSVREMSRDAQYSCIEVECVQPPT